MGLRRAIAAISAAFLLTTVGITLHSPVAADVPTAPLCAARFGVSPDTSITHPVEEVRSVASIPARQRILEPSSSGRLPDRPAAVEVIVKADVPMASITNSSALQLVGSTVHKSRDVSIRISHRAGCQNTGVTLAQLGETVTVDLIDGNGLRQAFGSVAKPWAFDADGTALRTWFTIEGSDLIQHVDTSDATGPVVFDPSYSLLPCSTYSGLENAETYLDLSTADSPRCPILGMFEAGVLYRPTYAYEDGIYQRYGRVAVRYDGECSTPGVAINSVGGFYNFTVPCLAHDYCYDLIRAGFGATVSKATCDSALELLALATCEPKGPVAEYICEQFAGLYSSAVVVFGGDIVWAPGYVKIRNQHSSLCLNVYGGWYQGPVVQYPCGSEWNGIWQIVPSGNQPGYFQLKTAHYTQECAQEFYTSNFNTGTVQNVYLMTACGAGFGGQNFWINAVSNQNRYTLRPTNITPYNRCVNVPGASLAPSIQVITWPCAEVGNDVWFIEAA